MKEWGPLTWFLVCCVLAFAGGYWLNEGGWALLLGAFAAWSMMLLTWLERWLRP